MGYLIRPLRGHLPLKGKAGGCHFKAFPFRGRWLAEGQTDEAGGQRPPACRRGRRPLRQNRKIPPSRRGGCPHPPAPEDSSTRRGGYQPPVSNRVPFTVGPVWDRPLRRSPDRSLHFRRGGTPGRPETARRGHRALQKDQTHLRIRRRGGSQTRPQFYCVHTEKGGNKHSLKHKNTGGPAGPPVFYFSFCSFIIATFRTINSR